MAVISNDRRLMWLMVCEMVDRTDQSVVKSPEYIYYQCIIHLFNKLGIKNNLFFGIFCKILSQMWMNSKTSLISRKGVQSTQFQLVSIKITFPYFVYPKVVAHTPFPPTKSATSFLIHISMWFTNDLAQTTSAHIRRRLTHIHISKNSTEKVPINSTLFGPPP